MEIDEMIRRRQLLQAMTEAGAAGGVQGAMLSPGLSDFQSAMTSPTGMPPNLPQQQGARGPGLLTRILQGRQQGGGTPQADVVGSGVPGPLGAMVRAPGTLKANVSDWLGRHTGNIIGRQQPLGVGGILGLSSKTNREAMAQMPNPFGTEAQQAAANAYPPADFSQPAPAGSRYVLPKPGVGGDPTAAPDPNDPRLRQSPSQAIPTPPQMIPPENQGAVYDPNLLRMLAIGLL
jgi:hypothetical protein